MQYRRRAGAIIHPHFPKSGTRVPENRPEAHRLPREGRSHAIEVADGDYRSRAVRLKIRLKRYWLRYQYPFCETGIGILLVVISFKFVMT